MACNCDCPYKHTSTALTDGGVLTVTNATNVGNFDKFCLILTINPDSIVTTAPVEYNVTVNDVNVPILDKWGYPITTDRLCVRKCYVGRYIESATPHVTLLNASSNETASTTTTTSGS